MSALSGALARASRVRVAAFDVDGVLTDGALMFDSNGVEYKAFSSRDGLGLKMLKSADIEVAIITARSSKIVSDRMQSLGIDRLFQGAQDKFQALQELCKQLSVTPNDIAYTGDDLLDLPVMRNVGFAIAVADAHPLVKRHAHWCTPSAGGRGAARESCEFILDAQGKLEAAFAPYLA